MKHTKLIITISVIIVVIILYFNYTYLKIEKFVDPPVLTGTDALKTLVLNGYKTNLETKTTIDNDVMCDRSNPDKIKCINKITIDHPLTPHMI